MDSVRFGIGTTGVAVAEIGYRLGNKKINYEYVIASYIAPSDRITAK